MSVLSLEDQRMEEYSSDIDEEYDHDHDHDHEEEEESGWTSYLIDFEIMNQRERDMKKKMMMSSSSHDDQSGYSMVSDDDDVTGSNGGGDVRKLPRKLKTIIKKKKKNRGEKVSDFEDPLEDTATSPHSSPKVSTFMIDDQMNSLMLTKKKGRSDNYDHKTGSPLGKGDRWYFHDQDQEMRSAAAGNEGRGCATPLKS